MKRFVIFTLLFPPLAMLVFNTPDMVSKGIPSGDDLLAWLIASYPIAIIPALLMAVRSAGTGPTVNDALMLVRAPLLNRKGTVPLIAS